MTGGGGGSGGGGSGGGVKGHARTRSLSDVIKSGRKRAQSVTAGEVVETLKAPISYKLVVRVLYPPAPSLSSSPR
jgi:hypothetical protein